MALGKRQRKLLVVLSVLLVGALVLGLSLPLWLPWALGPVARRLGAQYGDYHREGYGRFLLSRVGYTNNSVRFSARTVEALTPTAWLSRLGTGPSKSEGRFVSVSDWRLEVNSSTNFASTNAPGIRSSNTTGSVYATVQEVLAEVHALRRWIPEAVLSNGVVQVGEILIEIPAMTWSSGKVWGEERIPKINQEASVRADLGGLPPYHVEIWSDSLHLRSAIAVSTNSTGLDVRGTNWWWDN